MARVVRRERASRRHGPQRHGRRNWLFDALPSIAISRSGAIADAGTDALGNVNAISGSAKQYTITNTGRATLTITSVATGTLSNLTEATVSGITTPADVAPGGTTTFTVTYDPAATGALSCVVTVTSNTLGTLASYAFTASGTGIEQEIAVLDPSGAAIADGAAYSSAGGTEGVAAVHTWTVQNTGTDTLSCTVAISGETNCTATVTQALTATIAASGSDTYQVTVTPTAAGAWSYTTTVTSDDANEGTHDNAASGTAAAAAAAYSTRTELTYTMFGAGAPDSDGTPGEYQGMSYSAGVGWDCDSDFAAERDGAQEGTAWLQAPTVIWADAPTDYSLGFEAHIGPLPTTTNRGAGIIVGSAVSDADIVGGAIRNIGTKAVATVASTLDSNGGASASMDHARMYSFPLPGSGRQKTGPVIIVPRTALGAPIASTGYPMTGTGSSGNDTVHKMGPAWFNHAAGANNGASGPTRFRMRGFLMPRAPWDGGSIYGGSGSALGKWILVPYDGAAPSYDPGSVYVSGTAGDAFDITVDGTKGSNASGWDPSTGTKRPDWIITPPTGLVVDGSLPILVAIYGESGWDTADQLCAGVVMRPTGVRDGHCVMLSQASGGTQKRGLIYSDTAGPGASGSGASVVGVVGGLIPNVGESGSQYLGSAWVASYLADGPGALTLAGSASDNDTTFTTLELAIIVSNIVAGSANRRAHFSLWCCNPDCSWSEAV